MRVPYRKPTKFSYIPSDPLMTEDKLTELKNKLERLKKSRPQAAADVSQLAQLGDFSENVEYQLAKGRLRGINQGIIELEKQINQADIIRPHGQTDRVELGHKVTVENNGKSPPRGGIPNAGKKTFQILGSSETNPQKGVISLHSPLGAALIGRRVGETVKIKLAGQEAEYKIISIK